MGNAAYFIGNEKSHGVNRLAARCCCKSRHVFKKNFFNIQRVLWLYTALVSPLSLTHAGIPVDRLASGLCLALVSRSEASNR